jgi:hypothetical protein
MCILGYFHAFLLSTAGVDGLEQREHNSQCIPWIQYSFVLISFVDNIPTPWKYMDGISAGLSAALPDVSGAFHVFQKI